MRKADCLELYNQLLEEYKSVLPVMSKGYDLTPEVIEKTDYETVNAGVKWFVKVCKDLGEPALKVHNLRTPEAWSMILLLDCKDNREVKMLASAKGKLRTALNTRNKHSLFRVKKRK